MAKLSPTVLLEKIYRTVSSDEYKGRLATIHEHYPNLKSEGRYRDALLEVFNDEQKRQGSGLRAFAEAKKYDLVVTQPGLNDEGWLRIEFKYHFPYDFAHRVKSSLGRFNALSQMGTDSRGDLAGIVNDCVRTNSTSKPCDAFILIVQDRGGAGGSGFVIPASTRKKSHAHPVVYERGVPLHFVSEQIKLERMYPNNYREIWREPLLSMLRAIQRERRFHLKPPVTHLLPPSLGIPLTSHIFVLDFLTSDVPFAGVDSVPE